MRSIGKDVCALTASALLMRLIGVFYQSWLARRIGASGVGLWQLVQSVNVLSVTLAVSGIRFTTTRLVSEELGVSGSGSVGGAVGRCAVYAVSFGCAACLLTFFAARPIGFLWIGDARSVECIRVFSFALPLISLSCVLNGCFVAKGEAWKCALIQVFEQLVNICAVVLLLRRVSGGDLARCCAAIAKGSLIADAASLLLCLAFYGLSPASGRRISAEKLTGRMLRIALPLAVSAYARTGLNTLEQLLVPRKLRQSGLSADEALGGYGTVTGMVFPLLFFPTCLLGAVAELTVPELTAAQLRGDERFIRATVRKRLRLTAVFSLAVAAFCLLCADALGGLLYHDAQVAGWLRRLAPLIPVMYLDIVTDGCLKGLGEMMRSMRYNVGEALLGLALVVTLLPRYAMTGYLVTLYCCELWNFALSFSRLKRITGLRLWKDEKPRAARLGGPR